MPFYPSNCRKVSLVLSPLESTRFVGEIGVLWWCNRYRTRIDMRVVCMHTRCVYVCVFMFVYVYQCVCVFVREMEYAYLRAQIYV